jgi:hypothetical protein
MASGNPFDDEPPLLEGEGVNDKKNRVRIRILMRELFANPTSVAWRKLLKAALLA